MSEEIKNSAVQEVPDVHPDEFEEKTNPDSAPMGWIDRITARGWIIAAAIMLLPVMGLLFFVAPGCPIGCFGGIASDIYTLILVAFFGAAFVLLPVALSIFNFIKLFLPPFKKSRWRMIGICSELITISWGLICSVLWADISEIRWEDWDEVIYDIQYHSPIATWTLPTVAIVFTLSLVGYLILRLADAGKLPPLLGVLSMAAMYLGAALCVMWMLQIIRNPLLCVLPVNILLIYASTIRLFILKWRDTHTEAAEHKSPLIRFFAQIVNNAAHWSWIGLLLVLPLLGVVVAVLMLFGQAPDSVIQAWTQTADWTFSQQIAPPSVPYDGHYLCTVAAGGHRRLVRPVRTGKRRGHEVLVNRQLCVANAFEQLLEERMPRFHRIVRTTYDRTGLPLSRLIRTPLAADVVWVLMKPLEWIFLGVLYMFDAKPENRIAVQYPHAPIPEIKKGN